LPLTAKALVKRGDPFNTKGNKSKNEKLLTLTVLPLEQKQNLYINSSIGTKWVATQARDDCKESKFS
jgi:hypothetical protein